MSNEVLLILSIVLIYGAELLFLKLFGKSGLYCFTSVATIAANIEVLIMVNAFGMSMTLGNVLFASTFLCTDILSELYGKKAANKAVKIGIATNLTFIAFSQFWLLYTPSDVDFVMPAMKTVFTGTARVMLASVSVYVIVQFMDVFLYHKWWNLTTKKSGDSRKFLWVRNNGSTLLSQLLNTILFNVGAFYGTVPAKELISFICAGYIIFIVTSLADTPFIYMARKIH